MTSQLIKERPFEIRDFDEKYRNDPQAYERALSRYQYKMMWTNAANAILAVWLMLSPLLLNYKSQSLATSDIVSGALILLAETASFSAKRYWVRWITPFVGLWLLLAPLIFWAPQSAIYLNDTLVACFAISLSVLIPGTPGQGALNKSGPDKPPGWTYNPSSWIRRWLGIALALVGFCLSRYMAAGQLGYIDHVYDPFFGDGTEHVIHSSLSRSFPISDAGLGSVAYMLEVLAGFMGDRARWRTSPYVVMTFALLVLPLGITSVVLVITQPIIVHSWCGLCLIAATGLVTSVPLAVHELIALGQFMKAGRDQGKNLLKLFWFGGDIVDGGTPDPDRFNYSLAQRWIASVQGVTVPWTLALQLALGVWLMARPDLLPSITTSANCDHLLGALAVTAAAVATAEVTRLARYVNVAVGVALLVTGLLFARDVPAVLCSDLISGVALILLSLPRGEIVERYAGWDKFVK